MSKKDSKHKRKTIVKDKTFLKHEKECVFESKDLRDTYIPSIDLTNTSFKDSILKRCNFSNRDLSHSDFTNADLYQVDFSGAKLYTTNFRNADLTRANFTNAELYGIKLFDADVTRAIFDKIIVEEKKAKTCDDYEKAAEVYNTIKRSLLNHGQTSLAANYYYKHRVCNRKSYKNRIKRLAEYIFIDLLIGYGEKPIRTVYLSLFTIIFFSFLYILLPHFGIGEVINISRNVTPETLNHFSDILKSIEFSVSSFGGANIVDWQLIGIARVLMTIESFLGIILISIIMIGFTQKIIRM